MAHESTDDGTDNELIQSAHRGRGKGFFRRCLESCQGTPAQKLMGKWTEGGLSSECSFDGTLINEVWEEYAGHNNSISTDSLATLVSDCTEALVMRHAKEVLMLVLQSQFQDPGLCAKRMVEALAGAEGVPVTKGMFEEELATALIGLLPMLSDLPSAGGGARAPSVNTVTTKEMRSLKADGGMRDVGIDHPIVKATNGLTRQATNAFISERKMDRLATRFYTGRDLGTGVESESSSGPPPNSRFQRYTTLKGPLMDRAKMVPAAEEPRNIEPLFCKQLPGATMKKVREALVAEPWVVIKVVEMTVKGRDFEPSKWHDGVRIKGSKIRGMTFTMPKPEDIPSAVAKLQSIPPELSASTAFRMCSSDEEIVLVEQTSVPQVPFGENFEVLVTHCFRPYGDRDCDGSYGVNYYKWGVAVWVKEPSWTMKWIKGIIEKEVRVKAIAAGDVFMKMMLDATKT
jgi:hypothetical protein